MTGKQIMRIHTAAGVEDLNAVLDQVAIAEDLLRRMEQTMSKNKTAEHLGISKATLYEWREQEGIE